MVVWRNTLAAQGYNIGKSLLEADKVELAKTLIATARERGVRLLLPDRCGDC